MNVISGHIQPKGSGEAPASLRWGMELSAGDRDCGKKIYICNAVSCNSGAFLAQKMTGLLVIGFGLALRTINAGLGLETRGLGLRTYGLVC